MWGIVEDRQEFLKVAIEFTGNHREYGKWMRKVIKQWPISCEHNLTAVTMNRKAWLGHAACALAIKCPEDIVRQAWSHLTEEQQRKANEQAERTIKAWEKRYKGEPWQKNLWE
jgi:hypothetical protein